MKILLVAPYLPHPASGHGTGVFMYGVLERLSRRHEVTLVAFCDQNELALAKDLTALPLKSHFLERRKGRQASLPETALLALVRVGQLLRSIFLFEPYYVAKYADRRLGRLIQRLTTDTSFDIVQFEFPYMGQYAGRVNSGRLVLHEHDVFFRPTYRRYRRERSPVARAVFFLEWCRWARYERRIVNRVDHVLTVTGQDKSLLEWLTGRHHISYLPRSMQIPPEPPPYRSRDPHTMLFVGSFRHHPNLDAALWPVNEIYPLVQREIPDAKLFLVGADPPAVLTGRIAAGQQITCTGFVEDVGPYFSRCAVFAAPLRFGGGVKIKVIHAMASGMPVVTTKVGIEGIEGVPPGTVRVGSDAESIARNICSLLNDPRAAQEAGTRAHAAVRSMYSPERSLARLEEIYAALLRPSAGTS